MNIADTIDDARRAFAVGGRGCLVRFGEDEPRYATVSEIAVRLEAHPDATMLLTAVSEAVERYDPAREAAILLEVASGYQVLILSPEGYDYVSGPETRTCALSPGCTPKLRLLLTLGGSKYPPRMSE
jgi:hypothetical protein